MPIGERDFETTVPLVEIVEGIFHRLKTGCQWWELPTKEFFTGKILSWQAVYYYFNKWSKGGCWQKIWISLLKSNLKYLDLSSVESGGVPLDGSHTPAKNGGDAVGYQGRKACKTTNALFLCDNQGIMLGMSTPQKGEHHDLFQIQVLFDAICVMLKKANISLDGLFLNADPGFDSEGFLQVCEKEKIIPNIKLNPRNESSKGTQSYETGKHIFDEELYKDRSVIEQANSWIDGFKALLVRFEFSVKNWMSLHFMAFSVIFLRKINKKVKV